MPSYSTNAILTVCLSIICLILSLPSHAFLSNEANRAMDEANACGQAQQNHIYSECMGKNNENMKKAILNKSLQHSQNFSANKKQKLLQNIHSKIESNKQLCANEKTRFGDSMTGDRRYAYCLYENMLELLINVDRNIETYAR